MLRLTLAAGHYDRTEALRDGRVRAEGIDLRSLIAAKKINAENTQMIHDMRAFLGACR